MGIIQFLYTIPGIPLGYVLYFIYKFICSNVGIAIVIFTFIVKLAMLPIYIKQQKNQAKTSIFTPMIRDIQKKYANNREKQQEELMKLQEMGYKPMGGCGSMLLSLVILFGVIDVVYKPLTHIVHMNSTKITSTVEESYNIEITSYIVEEVAKTDSETAQLSESDAEKHNGIINDAQKLVDYYNKHCRAESEKEVKLEDFKTLTSNNVRIIRTAMKNIMLNEYAENDKISLFTNTDFYTITDAESAELSALQTDEEKANYRKEHSVGTHFANILSTASTHFGAYKVTSATEVSFQASAVMQRELYVLERFGSEVRGVKCSEVYSESVLRPEENAELSELYDNLNFVGIKLGQVPSEHMEFPMLLVPIISFILAFAQTFITNKLQSVNNPEMSQMAGMGPMKVVMYIMPLFSLWIAFTVPAGAGFYWAISYLFGIIQTLALNKLYNPQKLREQFAAEWEAAHPTKKGKKKNNANRTIDIEAESVTDEEDEETNNKSNAVKEEKLSQKEINRRKLAAARKAQAEKYGEEYHDDDDE